MFFSSPEIDFQTYLSAFKTASQLTCCLGRVDSYSICRETETDKYTISISDIVMQMSAREMRMEMHNITSSSILMLHYATNTEACLGRSIPNNNRPLVNSALVNWKLDLSLFKTTLYSMMLGNTFMSNTLPSKSVISVWLSIYIKILYAPRSNALQPPEAPSEGNRTVFLWILRTKVKRRKKVQPVLWQIIFLP